MSDTTLDQQATADDAGTKPAGTEANGKPEADNGALTVTPALQAHIDRIVEDRLSRQRAQFKKQEEEQRAKAQAERLAEQGEFKLLAEQRAARIAELEGELTTRELNTMRATVAARHKLPEHWISRLVGTSEAELDEDAARIAKDIAPPRAPAAEGGEHPRISTKQSVEKRVAELRKSGEYSAL